MNSFKMQHYYYYYYYVRIINIDEVKFDELTRGFFTWISDRPRHMFHRYILTKLQHMIKFTKVNFNLYPKFYNTIAINFNIYS